MYLSQRELGIQRSCRDQYCLTDRNKGLPWFIFIYFFNNSTGKQFLLAQAFTNFRNLRRQGEVYWQKGLISYNLVVVATIPIIKGAATSGKKKLVKNTILVLLI